MAVTIKSRSVTMTAVNDEDSRVLYFESLEFSGTGLTPGDQLVLTDSNGSTIATHYIENANENKEFVVEGRVYRGLKIDTAPGSGTWSVVAGVR